jgi:uncharacterized DUF497 family protein
MQYHFQWDPKKERVNRQKHGISFRLATQVFRDPMAMTLFDEEHSEDEERWITLGKPGNGPYLVVIHTFEQVDANITIIRMISARPATKPEIRQYEEGAQL